MCLALRKRFECLEETEAMKLNFAGYLSASGFSPGRFSRSSGVSLFSVEALWPSSVLDQYSLEHCNSRPSTAS